MVAKVAEGLLGPGGDFEVGLDSWPIGMPGSEKVIESACFLKGPKTLREFYDLRFLENAESTFIVFNEERYTYRQVWAQVCSLASQLAASGVGKGDRVAIAMRNYPEWCLAFLATTAIGAIIVPLNGWWKGKELEYGLVDSGAIRVFVDDERLSHVARCLVKYNIQAILVRSSQSASQLPPNTVHYEQFFAPGVGLSCPASETAHDDYACIMYTSGTTGNPKGVVLTNRGICSQLIMALLGDTMKKALTPPAAPGAPVAQPCVICPVPLFHVTASHHIFLSSIVYGAKLVLMFKWDAGQALKLIETERATAWTGVPTMVQDLMEHPNFDSTDTSSLQSMGGGGAPTPVSQVSKTTKKFGQTTAPSQGYGLTETNGAICTNSGDAYISRPTSTGQPFPIVELCVVDPDTGVRMAAGERGELLMRSPLVMSHYWNKPDKTAEAIIEVEGLGAGWFRSGDIAELDAENFIYIKDRAKDIIIRGGENISCAEVESAFMSVNGDIVEAAAFGVKEERLGEIVGIMLLMRAGTPEDGAALAASVKESGLLASFKLPAAENIFFTQSPLPRGATGKTLKREIRDTINAELAKGNRVSIRSRL